MKRLLLTGYEPFLSNTTNPTQALANFFDGQTVGGFKIFGRVLPVSYEKAPLELSKRMLETKPDAVLCLGLASDRQHITPELVAINYYHSLDPDNDGKIITETKICPDGPPAYFSPIPARKIAQEINAKGIPAKVSTTAGTYVCNQTMFELGKRIDKSAAKIPWGFIHVPANLDEATLQLAVTTAIENI